MKFRRTVGVRECPSFLQHTLLRLRPLPGRLRPGERHRGGARPYRWRRIPVTFSLFSLLNFCIIFSSAEAHVPSGFRWQNILVSGWVPVTSHSRRLNGRAGLAMAGLMRCGAGLRLVWVRSSVRETEAGPGARRLAAGWLGTAHCTRGDPQNEEGESDTLMGTLWPTAVPWRLVQAGRVGCSPGCPSLLCPEHPAGPVTSHGSPCPHPP